jgi:hypothetical protein
VHGTLRISPDECMRKRRSLKYAGLHPRTIRAYGAALDRFLKFVRRRRLKLRSESQLDRQISEFIDHLYQEGEPMSYGGHLLSAVKRFHPELRLCLPRSSQLFRNWQRCYVPSRALPASWALVEALMGVAFSQHLGQLSLLLALGFNCLLRTSEMLSLTHQHLVVHDSGRAMSVIIPGSKTSQGNPQVLLIQDLPLVHLAQRILRPRSKTLLWDQGPHRFREQFSALLGVLGFGPHDYTPYCLRRGGATWFFQSSLSMDATVARGRWSCARTAKGYIDEGTMQLAQTHWSRDQTRLVKRWRRLCKAYRLRQ